MALEREYIFQSACANVYAYAIIYAYECTYNHTIHMYKSVDLYSVACFHALASHVLASLPHVHFPASKAPNGKSAETNRATEVKQMGSNKKGWLQA